MWLGFVHIGTQVFSVPVQVVLSLGVQGFGEPSMRIVFVHGWSVTNTDTYGDLPAVLVASSQRGLRIAVDHLYLGKYVSFSDEVTVDDIARGMQFAVSAEILPKLADGERFACITHSTGGPVVRSWITLFYGDRLDQCPLSHLVMLAPANHGSALAQLGKGKLARMKFFADGVQPGVGVLSWLELGSEGSWALNSTWLGYDTTAAGLYTFVLTGQTIDRSFYDNLNTYTGEAGSDGVVRVAAANMNYSFIRLEQQEGGFRIVNKGLSSVTAFAVLADKAHSGDDLGIMKSVRRDSGSQHETVVQVLQCLRVRTAKEYGACIKAFDTLTGKTQELERKRVQKSLFLLKRTFSTSRYFMLVFKVCDDRGNNLTDYDIVFTAGPDYDPNHLPPDFVIDRQRNSQSPGKLTYYLDYDVMAEWFPKKQVQDRFGFRISARPDAGFAYYTVCEHRGTYSDFAQYFRPNQTVMVEIVLQRHVRSGVFALTQDLSPQDFHDQG